MWPKKNIIKLDQIKIEFHVPEGCEGEKDDGSSADESQEKKGLKKIPYSEILAKIKEGEPELISESELPVNIVIRKL